MSNSTLVSVVIPCYNAARWVAEAVESCLKQTYPAVEVIVVDDGSTDDSLEVLTAYGHSILIEAGPNRGGNHARNRGFELSRGEYVQFLDADDYLLPEKLAHQVQFLEETGADGVYGDWRHQHHQPDGSYSLGEVVASGEQDDLLAALLRDWWVAPVAVLFRREAVSRAGGWDEALSAAQDRDFMLAVVLSGGTIQYQPGCSSIYRRYGSVTVSTSNTRRWLENHFRVLEKAERRLMGEHRLSDDYRHALAQSYFSIARNYYDISHSDYQRVMKHVMEIAPGFRPSESRLYGAVQRLLGFSCAEKLASYKRRVSNQVGTGSRP